MEIDEVEHSQNLDALDLDFKNKKYQKDDKIGGAKVGALLESLHL